MSPEKTLMLLNLVILIIFLMSIIVFIFGAYMAYKLVRKEHKRKGYLVVPIEKLKEYREYLKRINDHDLNKIIFTENDEDIKLNPKIVEEFKYTGLNNVHFIETGFFEHGFTIVEK